jgi:hypothetical protein
VRCPPPDAAPGLGGPGRSLLRARRQPGPVQGQSVLAEQLRSPRRRAGRGGLFTGRAIQRRAGHAGSASAASRNVWISRRQTRPRWARS